MIESGYFCSSEVSTADATTSTTISAANTVAPRGEVVVSRAWDRTSWRHQVSLQQPKYEDENILAEALKTISSMPDIVCVEEITELKQHLKKCESGTSFFIQMGDCAERFDELSDDFIGLKVRSITAAARIFATVLGKECIRIGRMAGQYAKPRSSEYESLPNGLIVPSFRGANVNTMEDRNPNPTLLVQGHRLSNETARRVKDVNNQIISQTITLHRESQTETSKQVPANAILSRSTSDDIPVFISHEGLLLNFEESVTRQVGSAFYNQGAHLLWIGERTRQLDGGHVELFRGIQNPIAVKVSQAFDPKTLKELCGRLNPKNEKGKMIVVCRFGYQNVETALPELIKAKKASGLNFSWSCDPMHGNTFTTSNNIKSRDVTHVLTELKTFASILHAHGECVAGVHLETSPYDVTECIGVDIEEHNLHKNYTSACDPRLNLYQTLAVCNEVAHLIASLQASANKPQAQ